MFLENKRDAEGIKTTQTGTKPKRFKCEQCIFEVKTQTKLKGHKTIHDVGNVNYVQMKNCDKCGLLVKTTGLLRRHMKTNHGINMTSAPVNQDAVGARSVPNENINQQEQVNRIKCDRCEFRAATKKGLVDHLDKKHSLGAFRYKVCDMVANTQEQLTKHNLTCHWQNDKVRKICQYWQKGQCNFDKKECRFFHPDPPKCRYKSDCEFLPNCKFGRDEKLCRYQENCLNFYCAFVHHNTHFFSKWPKCRSTKYPVISGISPAQMWRPW